MRTTQNQAGFGAVALIAVVLVLGAIGGIGYTVMNRQAADTDTAVTSQSSGEPASIRSEADLRKTDQSLDQASAELDSNLDDTKLDADLNTML
ncbi:MAG TPA: hypothetical protein VF572_01035 [Candidatus Saccharimonadales bacterium]|jgi:uncharacterized protein HemX